MRAVLPIRRCCPTTETENSTLWGDVFVEQKLPWGRFLQSAFLHTVAVVLLWTISIALIRQQKILDHAAFDRSALITYSPQEYLATARHRRFRGTKRHKKGIPPTRSSRSCPFRERRTIEPGPSSLRPI